MGRIFIVVGCADKKLPSGVKWERTGHKLTVVCNSTGEFKYFIEKLKFLKIKK